MSLERVTVEGVVVDDLSGDAQRTERFCQGVVEGMTEYDWAELPDDLRDPLRAWVRRFRGWMMENP